MLNIVCTSKPCDGLFYYSYEYCSHLNQQGIEAQVYVITHRDFTSGDYTEAISDKYIHCQNVVFNNEYVEDCITLILGRSMMTLAHMSWNDYRPIQQESLKKLFGGKVISVYSENHPEGYPKALERFKPTRVIDLCDTDVYPNGVGAHFEKIIHFDIYKEVIDDIQFDHLFLGTNEDYYKTVQKVIGDYPDHGIITYPQKYLDLENNNLRAPVPNLLGKFKTYVYTKNTFDPAPRIFQECRFLGKEIIYLRDDDVRDGGYWYWKRGIKAQDLSAILYAFDQCHGKISVETDLALLNIPKQTGNELPAPTVQWQVDRNILVDNMNKDKIWYCSIPFLMAFTTEEGNFTACNFSNDLHNIGLPVQDVNNTTVEEWMTGDVMEALRKEMVDPNHEKEKGLTGRMCAKCLYDEKTLSRSRRMIANANYKLQNENPKMATHGVGIEDNIINAATRTVRNEPYKFEGLGRILEIQVKSFGIECNLDCQMCHHFSSSMRSTMAFKKGVWNEVVWGPKDEREAKAKIAASKKPVDQINKQIVKLAPHIWNLKIIGGEPLVMKKHYELLDMLIESGESKFMQIKYQTNGTVTKAGKHNIFDYIPHFKSFLITVSIDGVDQYNDYIRRRSSYNEIVKNIKMLNKHKNVDIELNSVVTFFSVLHLYKLNKLSVNNTLFNHNWWRIDMPAQMKANNLPDNIKDILIPIYEDIPHLKEIATLLRMPPEPDFNAVELYKYCQAMDASYKGTQWEMDVLDVFPELIPHYESTRPKESYCVELPEIKGVVESVKNTDWYLNILKEKPVGELWFEGITHHRIPADHPVYNILNKQLMHGSDTQTVMTGIQDPDNLPKAEVRAYLSVQSAGVDFIPHTDTGFHMIFPFELGKDYALQYLSNYNRDEKDESRVVYEHKYRCDKDNNVIGILHNGPNHVHTVRWNEPKDKYWVQIIFNPLNDDWDTLLEEMENLNLFNLGEDAWIN